MRREMTTSSLEDTGEVLSGDVALACTLYAMHSRPLHQWHIPRLLVEQYYNGQQEDANEFIECLLGSDGCSRAVAPWIGIDEPEFRCRVCGWSRAAAAECFSSLHLPLVRQRLPAEIAQDCSVDIITTVQDAVNDYFRGEIVETFTSWKCERPGCSSTLPPVKTHVVREPPRLLRLQLKRWWHIGMENALLHHVDPTEEITLGGFVCKLRSIVVHLGSSCKSGHYIALVRRQVRDEAWYRPTRYKSHHQGGPKRSV